MKKTFNINDKVVVVKTTNKGTTTYLLNGKHYVYQITIMVDDKKENFRFHDSIYNYSHGITATESMIDCAVDCIISDAYAYANNRNSYVFCNEYGYDNFKQGERVFNECMDTYYKLINLLTDEEISTLFELVQ